MNQILKSLIPLLAVVLLSINIAGCVRFYRTSDVQNTMKDTERKLQELAVSIDSYRAEHQNCYDQITAGRFDVSMKPYPQIASSIQKLSMIVAAIRINQQVAAAASKDFNALMAGKEGQNIQSNKPEWDAFKPIYTRVTNLHDTISICIEEANEIQADLQSLYKKYGIGKMNAEEMRSKIAALINDLDQIKTKASQKIPQDTASISNLETILQRMSSVRDEIAAELSGKTEIWVSRESVITNRFETVQRLSGEANNVISKMSIR